MPERIVSLSPTHTEILFAIGAGDQVVAVDNFSTYPPETAAVVTDLSAFEPNVEAVAGYEPDLVVTEGTNPDFLAQLDSLGLTHWEGPAPVGFSDVYAQIEQLGATDRPRRRGRRAGRARCRPTSTRSSPGCRRWTEPLSVYHELDNTYFSVTSDTFIGQVYNRLGLRNIADEAEGTGGTYPQLNAEFIISTNPDLIFLADTKCCGESAETVAARPGWASIAAVANGGVVEMDDDIASRWGPRLVDYMRAVPTPYARSSAGRPSAAVDRRRAVRREPRDGRSPVAARRDRWWLLASAAILLGAFVLGAMVGPAGPDWWRVPLAVLDHLPLVAVDSGVSDAEWNVIWQIRMPRVVLAGVVGAMLSLAGASYQGVFRNPLVDPYLLGAAAGAGLGATIVFTVARSATAGWPVDPAPDGRLRGRPGDGARDLHRRRRLRRHPVSGHTRARRGGGDVARHGGADVHPPTPLRGRAAGVQLDPRLAVDRAVGPTCGWSLPYVAAATVVLLLHRRHLDLLRVGDDEASSLGAPVARVRLIVVIAATLGTAAVVAVSGLIGFVGIVVPHLIRLTRRFELLPGAAAVGPARRGVPDPRRHPGAGAHRSGRDARSAW